MELSTVNHLVAALALALTFGGMTFFSAVFTPLVFAKLSMKIAGPFIRQVFPWYYLTIGGGHSDRPVGIDTGREWQREFVNMQTGR